MLTFNWTPLKRGGGQTGAFSTLDREKNLCSSFTYMLKNESAPAAGRGHLNLEVANAAPPPALIRSPHIFLLLQHFNTLTRLLSRLQRRKSHADVVMGTPPLVEGLFTRVFRSVSTEGGLV